MFVELEGGGVSGMDEKEREEEGERERERERKRGREGGRERERLMSFLSPQLWSCSQMTG